MTKRISVHLLLSEFMDNPTADAMAYNIIKSLSKQHQYEELTYTLHDEANPKSAAPRFTDLLYATIDAINLMEKGRFIEAHQLLKKQRDELAIAVNGGHR